MTRRRAPHAVNFERTAVDVQKLSVLLAAGIAPDSAWNYLDEEIGVAVSAGSSVTELLSHRELPWRVVGAAWQVATQAGAPVAPALASFAAMLRDLAQTERHIATALTGPVATARLVMILPAIGLLFGTVLGFDPFGVMVSTLSGAASAITGLALLTLGALWNRKLVSSARPRDVTAGVAAELMAIALAGGASIDRAASSVTVAVERAGLHAAHLAGRGTIDPGVKGALDLSRRAGVPASDLLRSHAQEARRAAAATAIQKAESLGVKLVIPLGVCVLPAFMLLGVAPLLIGVISSTTGQW